MTNQHPKPAQTANDVNTASFIVFAEQNKLVVTDVTKYSIKKGLANAIEDLTKSQHESR